MFLIGLQKIILELLLSYNPLWLRIGLETIYGESILLRTNDDLTGLTKFLLSRFFSDPYLVKTHSHSMHPNIRLPSFQGLMNKFILKKFLCLVYFLDFSKNNKLVGHDPCLFHKKASIKDSRSILLEFSRQALGGIGDITKVLRHYGYVVTHKQTHLDEYDYAVVNISTDLRDGVRLCRVMEIITGKKCLTCRCRLPAISRLQRVHNVNVALTSLIETGYNIQGNIDGKSIADGHKEKTLSLLWQIIYKFQAPRYEKAAKTLQKWWRSKLCYIRIKNILKNIKNHSANVIQRSWRCYSARKKFNILKEDYYRELKLKEEAAKKIQNYWRRRLEAKQQQKYFQNLKLSVTIIQKWWKRIYHTRNHVKVFNEKRILIKNIQQKWRAKKLMKSERNIFLKQKSSTIKIQNYWRSYKLGKLIYNDYQNTRKLILLIQRKWRSKILTSKERELYLKKLKAINNIKLWWKRYLIFKKERNNFIQIKNSVRCIENLWIAKIEGKKEREKFLLQKSSADKIKKSWKRYKETRNHVQEYKRKQKTIIKIQSWWRMIIKLNEYKKVRRNCIVLQKWWRSAIITKSLQSDFLLLKKSTLIIQKNWRMKKYRSNFLEKKSAVLKIEQWYLNLIVSRNVRKEYLKLKASVKIIENRWKSIQKMRSDREAYLQKIRACTIIQSRWRAKRLMERERENYLKLRIVVIKIQSIWRMILKKRAYEKLVFQIKAANLIKSKWKAVKLGKKIRRNYLKQYCSIILLQRKWKAIILGNSVRLELERKRKAAIIIQKNWRSYVAFQDYKRKKSAINLIKNWIKHKQFGARVKKEYLELKNNVVKMQRLWRKNLIAKRFKKQREAAIIIQKYWRSYLAAKNYKNVKKAVKIIEDYRIQLLKTRELRSNYLQTRKCAIFIQSLWRRNKVLKALSIQRESAIKIQRFWRSYKEMKILKQQFIEKRKAAITIQNFYRAQKLGLVERKKYHIMIISIIKIQRWWNEIFKSRKIRVNKLRRKWAVRTIEKWWILSCEQKLERERMNQAATKIQAAWKGFRIRKKNCTKLEIVRERAKKAAEAAVPTATLAYRLQESVEFFIRATNIGQLSICLSSLGKI